MTQKRDYTPEELNFYLRFKNPLAIIADQFYKNQTNNSEDRYDEFSAIFEYLEESDAQEAKLKKYDLI